MNRASVYIIVPIYNAYDDVKACVDSIIKYTDLSVDRLLLINDCSSDERILPLLNSYIRNGVVVINNENNKGFSGNVNFGMNYSEDRDVLILNSDTLVTKNWINKIYNCAHSATEIGTVTPLSNAATLASVPVFCEDNAIPDGFDVDSYADLVEHCSLKEYPRVPVAVGFCMYIKRSVIKEIGLFDEETFKRGYGEENDFCHRAEQAGFIHVLCDDTFIYHKGTQSFGSEEKKRLIEDHTRIINERYPAQNGDVAYYCSMNPHQYIRDNINRFSRFCGNKKNLLYVTHLDFREDAANHTGGTQFHLKTLVEAFKEEYNVFVLTRAEDKIRLSIYMGDVRDTLEFPVGYNRFPYLYRDKEYAIYENILKTYRIQIVHVQHVAGLSFDIFKAAKNLNIPTVLTLHDYYYICPAINLYSPEIGFCMGKANPEVCDRCLKENCGYYKTEGILAKWQENCKEILFGCEKIVTPSNSCKEIYNSYYPGLAERITVIEHGTEMLPASEGEKSRFTAVKVNKDKHVKCSIEKLEDRDGDITYLFGWCYKQGVDSKETKIYIELTTTDGETLMFPTVSHERPDVASCFGDERYNRSGFEGLVFRGAMLGTASKLRVVIEHNNIFYSDNKYVNCTNVIQRNPDISKTFNIAYFGAVSEKKGSGLLKELIETGNDDISWFVIGDIGDFDIIKTRKANVHFIGKYNRDEMQEYIEKYRINLIIIPSLVPETFSYILSESILCGIPVLVKDIGALGERVRKHDCGWIIPKEADIAYTIDLIESIKDNIEEYKRVCKNVKETRLNTCAEMVHEYRKLYGKIDVSYGLINSDGFNDIVNAYIEV